jgi:hypothetical protein
MSGVTGLRVPVRPRGRRDRTEACLGNFGQLVFRGQVTAYLSRSRTICPGKRGAGRVVMSSAGSNLAVRTGRFRGAIEETEDSDSTGNYLWLGVRGRDLPTNFDVFLAFLAPAALGAHVRRCAPPLKFSRTRKLKCRTQAG